MDIVSLIIQLVSGLAGGNAIGQLVKQYSLGTTNNSIVGLIGGLLGGQFASLLGATGAGGLDPASVLGDIVGGGAGGAVLTLIAGIVRQALAK